jgi:Tfp pilus assembly protein PilO
MDTNIKTKLRAISLSLVLTFIGIAVSFYFLKNIAIKVKENKIKVAEINRDISLINKISQEKNQYENDIKKIKNTLPSEYYQISFFTKEIERLSQNNGLTLNIKIDSKKNEETDTVSSIKYVLEVDGSYTSISNFLTQLSKLPYHTSLNQMNIERKEGEPVGKIVFKLFVQK